MIVSIQSLQECIHTPYFSRVFSYHTNYAQGVVNMVVASLRFQCVCVCVSDIDMVDAPQVYILTTVLMRLSAWCVQRTWILLGGWLLW